MDDDVEKAVRDELEEVARQQEAIQERLRFLLANLPPSPREDVMLAGEEDYDFTTEVRTALECILADWIGTAIRRLHDLARYGRENLGRTEDRSWGDPGRDSRGPSGR